MNDSFVKVLSELADIMTRRGEPFRAKAYREAADAIMLYPETILDPAQLKDVPKIGKTVMTKLKEFTSTGTIDILEQERANPLNHLTRVYGIGPKKAKALIEKGITTIEALREHQDLLTDAMKIGLKYFHDIETRIPRDEIDEYNAYLKKVVPVTFDIVGSYRRGALDSGDIDIILTHTDPTVFDTILDGLIQKGIIIEVLSRGKTKSLTIGQLPGKPARRVDFLYTPPNEYAFATLYFTGSKAFNTKQRHRALKMGYTLNEHGLYQFGEKIPGTFLTERAIFEFLEMEWKEPHERTGEIQKTEAELSALIRKANVAYYENKTPIMTDQEYDKLCEETLRRFPNNQAAREGHTTSIVSKNKVQLPYEMWSMDKIKPDTNALDKWEQVYRGPYVLSCKLDGISALYSTESGIPKLYTRGNGRVGQDISHLIPYLSLPLLENVTVRGELIMSKDIFTEYYSSEFANARNLVAGIVNKKSVNTQHAHHIDFVAYEVITPNMRPSEQMMWLDSQEMCSVLHVFTETISREALSNCLVAWRNEYEYEIDGVICIDDHIYSRKDGNPKHAFAFKMMLDEQTAETTVKNVIWSASKDGYLKPRIQIEPVCLGGAMIEYVTGFNGKYIQQHHIGIGATIRIVRSGDVIPHIVDVVKPANKPLMPTQNHTWNESGIDIVLVNKNDDVDVQQKNIVGFFRGLGVEGLSTGNVSRLMDAGFDTVAKIITMTLDDYMKIDGFREKMAAKLQNGVHNAIDRCTLPELMHATNLFGRGFGVKKFQAILNEFPQLPTTVEQVESVPGMATKSASRFIEQLPAFLEWIETTNLHEKLVYKTPRKSPHNAPLKNVKFVFSGFRDKELIDKLVALGATQSTNVTKNTSIVIAKNKKDSTTKLDDARRLRIPIITPEELINQLTSNHS